MKYIKKYESIVGDKDKEDFLNEIKNIFIDAVVDECDIEIMPDDLLDNEDYDIPGIFYHIYGYDFKSIWQVD